MDIWVAGTSNELFLKGSKTGKKVFKKKKVVTGKTPLFVIGPFCSRRSVCLNTDCHIKTCRSFRWRAILKIPSTGF